MTRASTSVMPQAKSSTSYTMGLMLVLARTIPISLAIASSLLRMTSREKASAPPARSDWTECMAVPLSGSSMDDAVGTITGERSNSRESTSTRQAEFGLSLDLHRVAEEHGH
jgi:hypothetical protein